MKTSRKYKLLGSAMAIAALAGCDSFSERFLGKQNILVLSATPISFSTQPTLFDTNDKAEVVGSLASVCIPLRGDLPIDPTQDMDRVFRSLLRNATLRASIVTSAGRRVTLGEAMQAWSLEGVVENANELSACLNLDCATEGLDDGTVVSTVEISSDIPFKARGAYWSSRSVPGVD